MALYQHYTDPQRPDSSQTQILVECPEISAGEREDKPGEESP